MIPLKGHQKANVTRSSAKRTLNSASLEREVSGNAGHKDELTLRRDELKHQASDLAKQSKKVLLSEARAIAILAFDTFFPNITDQNEISCWNCMNYVNGICAGKRLDYHGVIDCMVSMAIHGSDDAETEYLITYL